MNFSKKTIELILSNIALSHKLLKFWHILFFIFEIIVYVQHIITYKLRTVFSVNSTGISICDSKYAMHELLCNVLLFNAVLFNFFYIQYFNTIVWSITLNSINLFLAKLVT